MRRRPWQEIPYTERPSVLRECSAWLAEQAKHGPTRTASYAACVREVFLDHYAHTVRDGRAPATARAWDAGNFAGFRARYDVSRNAEYREWFTLLCLVVSTRGHARVDGSGPLDCLLVPRKLTPMVRFLRCKIQDAWRTELARARRRFPRACKARSQSCRPKRK